MRLTPSRVENRPRVECPKYRTLYVIIRNRGIEPNGSIVHVAKTVILGGETARDLLEAYASLAAWFYQMSDAMRRGEAGCEPPSAAHRRAYLTHLASTYPELGAIIDTIEEPRPYLPPPVLVGPVAVVENPTSSTAAQKALPADEPPPPAVVDPDRVKY